MDPIKILVVDDHTLFRKGLVGLLTEQESFEVIGEAKDGQEGVDMARELHPDLVLMDLQMPRLNGIAATQTIRENTPETSVVILTISEDDEDLFNAVKAGAKGYLLKNIKPEQLFKSLEMVARGEAIIPRSMASKLLDEFSLLAKKAEEQVKPKNQLTNREKEILQALSDGSSNKEIANTLCISENTVKIHLRNILKKLHFSSRIQAAVYALKEGLIEQPGKKTSQFKKD